MNTTTNPQEPNLSIYQNEDAVDDFPVLKAFQQYIDAEQAKARKRMTILSVVFGFLLVAVVGIFMMRLSDVGRRNQEIYDKLAERNQQLNDRLVEYAMKDRSAASSADSSAAIKTMTETITALQKQLLEQQVAAAKAAAEREKQASAPSPAEQELSQRNREESLRLKKVAAQIKAEKAKLKAEKERQRQEEIERQRRRLYPAYYAKKDAEKKREANATQDLLDGIEGDLEEEELNDEDAIEYFQSDETEYKIPVEIKGKSANWRIPVK